MKVILSNISLKSVHKKLFLLALILITALPIVLYHVSQSMIDEISSTSKDVYGAFTNVYYYQLTDSSLTVDEEKIEELLPGFVYESFGAIYTVSEIENDTSNLFIGYMDEDAMTLSRVKLLEGSWPSRDDQIALTSSALTTLLPGGQIGDVLEIEDKEYILSGIVGDYGELWPRGEKQNGVRPVNVFLTRTAASELYDVIGYSDVEILFDSNLGYSSSDSSDYFFQNMNNQRGVTEQYALPSSFLIILSVSGFSILFSIISLAFSGIQHKYMVYQIWGMTRRQRFKTYLWEYGILTLIAILIGNILGYIFSFLGILLVNYLLDTSMSLDFSFRSWQITLLAFALAFLSLVLNHIKLSAKKSQSSKIKSKVSTYFYMIFLII